MQKLTAMFQYIRRHFSEGWLYDFEKSKHTQTHRSTTIRYHGDRGARGSSGSCSANDPGGCRIFANFCYSVRVCARGQICGLTETQHLEKKDNIWKKNASSRSQTRIVTKHPFLVDFPISEIVRTNIRLHMQLHRSYGRRILYRSRSMAYFGVP